MKKIIISAVLAVMLISAAYIAVFAAGGADDPLITLSYLQSVLLPSLKEEQQKQVAEINAAAIEELKAQLASSGAAVSGGGDYIAIELHEGEGITGQSGAIEVLLRRGEFTAIDPVGDRIANLTQGGEAGDGAALTLQNLYLIPRSDGRGVRCMSGSAWVMVRGAYNVIDYYGNVTGGSGFVVQQPTPQAEVDVGQPAA